MAYVTQGLRASSCPATKLNNITGYNMYPRQREDWISPYSSGNTDVS